VIDSVTRRSLPLAGVRRYLSSRFPPSQGGAVLSGFVCTYLLYSQAAGDHPFAAVAIPAWFPVATVIKRSVTTNRFFRYLVNETCPPAMLAYGYLVWHDAGGKPLAPLTVTSVIALLWVSYQVWNFTRGIVSSGEFPPWGMRLRSVQWALLAFLALSAGVSVGVTAAADLSPPFLVYSLALPLTFAVLVVRWWRSLPTDVDVKSLPASRKPRWAGLWYPAAVELGIVFGVVISGIGG